MSWASRSDQKEKNRREEKWSEIKGSRFIVGLKRLHFRGGKRNKSEKIFSKQTCRTISIQKVNAIVAFHNLLFRA